MPDSKQLVRQLRNTFRRLGYGFQVVTNGIANRDRIHRQTCVTQSDRQHIVEFASATADHSTRTLHFLGLVELFLQFPALANIAGYSFNRHRQSGIVVDRDASQLEPARAAVLSSDAECHRITRRLDECMWSQFPLIVRMNNFRAKIRISVKLLRRIARNIEHCRADIFVLTNGMNPAAEDRVFGTRRYESEQLFRFLDRMLHLHLFRYIDENSPQPNRLTVLHIDKHRVAKPHSMAIGMDHAVLQLMIPSHGCRTHVCLCLLYTSDAADERSSVDLGGRRI